MAKAKRRKVPRCIITDEQVNRLQIILEQIEGCAQLIISHDENIAHDNPMFTAVNVIIEKAKAADEIVRAGYGK
jgi:hypothetical protein